MSKIKGNYIIYTADDEMPICIRCDNVGGKFDCEKYCGPKCGWYGYKRFKRINESNEERT